MTRRYRVYPNSGRARAFDSFAGAVAFAERAYAAQQAAGDLRAVHMYLALGDGSLWGVGWFGPFGWKAGGLRAFRKPGGKP